MSRFHKVSDFNFDYLRQRVEKARFTYAEWQQVCAAIEFWRAAGCSEDRALAATEKHLYQRMMDLRADCYSAAASVVGIDPMPSVDWHPIPGLPKRPEVPPEDRCPGCGATRAEVTREGHRDITEYPGQFFTKTCPEACTCLPEHFTMAEHDAREREKTAAHEASPAGDRA